MEMDNSHMRRKVRVMEIIFIISAFVLFSSRNIYRSLKQDAVIIIIIIIINKSVCVCVYIYIYIYIYIETPPKKLSGFQSINFQVSGFFILNFV